MKKINISGSITAMLICVLLAAASVCPVYAGESNGTEAVDDTLAEEPEKQENDENGEAAEVQTASETESGQLLYDGVLYDITKKAGKKNGTVRAAGFEGKSLKKLVFPDYIEYNGKKYTVTAIGDGAFDTCRTVEAVLNPGMKKIGTGAFAGSKKLCKLTLSDGCRVEIADGAFYGCVVLDEIVNGENSGILSIGAVAFANTALSKIDASLCTVIGDDAFSGCSALKKAVIGDGLKKIGVCVFTGVSKKFSLEHPDEMTYFEITDGCFYSREDGSLVNGELASGTVKLTDGITSVPEYCFSENRKLKKVIIPDSVKKIGECAFMNCTALKAAGLSSSLRYIAGYAFYGCGSLEKITLPASVEQIDGNPFMYCPKLKTIKVAKDNKNYIAVSNMLCSHDRTSVISAPGKSGEVTLPSSARYIEPFAFCGNSSITSLKMNKKLQVVGLAAFYDCSSLAYVYVPTRKIDFTVDAWIVDEDGAEYCGIFHGCAPCLEINLPYSKDSGTAESIESFILQHCEKGTALTQR